MLATNLAADDVSKRLLSHRIRSARGLMKRAQKSVEHAVAA